MLLSGGWTLAAARQPHGYDAVRDTISALADVAATAVLLGLMTWFAVELRGEQTGSAERAAAGAQALWPLAVVLSTRRGPRPQPLGRT